MLEAAGAIGKSAQKTIKAAVVEDDQFVAQTFAARLEKNGVTATVFHTLTAAREALLMT